MAPTATAFTERRYGTAVRTRFLRKRLRTRLRINGNETLETNHKRQTDKRKKRLEFNLVHFSLKMWHLVAIILTIFLIIYWQNFVSLLVDPDIFIPSLNFLWSITDRPPPIGWTHLTDTTDRCKRTNERTKRRISSSVRPFVRSSLSWSLTLPNGKSYAVHILTYLYNFAVTYSLSVLSFLLGNVILVLGVRSQLKVHSSGTKYQIKSNLYYCAPKSWPESWPTLSTAHRNN